LLFSHNFEKGLKLYKNREWKQALELLKELSVDRNDLSVDLYKQRCQEFILNPPEENWDGVFYAKIK
jgi:adenylate cyclase